MEKKFVVMFVVCLAFAMAVTGCNRARVYSTPGTYTVSGTTTHPEAAIMVSSDAYVQQQNTEQYWQAVREGRAMPYLGGGMGSDYWYYYGSAGINPHMPSGPVVIPAPPPGSQPSGDVGTPASSVAEQKANDALKAIIEHVSESEENNQSK